MTQQTIFGCDCPVVACQYPIWGEQIFVHVPPGKDIQQYTFIIKMNGGGFGWMHLSYRMWNESKKS